MTTDLISEHGFRQDGRKPFELRTIKCEMGVNKQADGTAYLEMGNTKVLAAVYGPHEPRLRSKVSDEKCLVNCQYSMTTFSTTERKLRPRGDRKSYEFTQHLQKTFETAILTESYPRSQIDIFCEILQADGGSLSACVNAASLALIDAGIPMRGIVTAVSGACVQPPKPPDLTRTGVGVGASSSTGEEAMDTSISSSGAVCLLDLTYAEESAHGAGLMTMAIVPSYAGRAENSSEPSCDIVLLEMERKIHFNHLEKMLSAVEKGCLMVHDCIKRVAKAHIAECIVGLSA